jgi:S-disulfanyl-L-cysteine oxidoreductase SoxD
MSRWREALAPFAGRPGSCEAAIRDPQRRRRVRGWIPALRFASAGMTALVLAASAPAAEPGHKKLDIGREASSQEIAGWDIAIRPDGRGLPPGKGTVKDGEALYLERCAACHGEFGESAGRWPILAGGNGTLASHDPVKSIGSYWPYASTVMDYIRRSMPYGNAQSLTNDELYAVTAYVLYLNDVIKDEAFELSRENFTALKLPNEPNFFDDDREIAEKEFWKKEPCMTNCLSGEPRIVGRARAIDVTPEAGKGPNALCLPVVQSSAESPRPRLQPFRRRWHVPRQRRRRSSSATSS